MKIDINSVISTYQKLNFLCQYEDVAKELKCSTQDVQKILIECMHDDIDTFLQLIYSIWRQSTQQHKCNGCKDCGNDCQCKYG